MRNEYYEKYLQHLELMLPKEAHKIDSLREYIEHLEGEIQFQQQKSKELSNDLSNARRMDR